MSVVHSIKKTFDRTKKEVKEPTKEAKEEVNEPKKEEAKIDSKTVSELRELAKEKKY